MKKLFVIMVSVFTFFNISFADHKGGVAKDFECIDGFVHLRWVNSETEYFHIVSPKKKCEFTAKEIQQKRDKKKKTDSINGKIGIGVILIIIVFIIYRNIKNRPEQIPDKKTQRFLTDLEDEAKLEKKNQRTTQIKVKNKEKKIGNDLGASLKRLKRMYNDGHLTKVEFEKAKNKLLK
tara:strand:+ start:334 stop:867 length:534 start_codon:yes stop_codon:yes gene_type:complete